MRKRKAFMAVDENKWTRDPRSRNDRSRISNHQTRGTTVGLSFDPNRNSDDDFSMESWKRRALASSKTPKMSNLTTDVVVPTLDKKAEAAALRTTTSNNHKNDRSHSHPLQQPEPQQQSKKRPIHDGYKKTKVDRQASVHAQQTMACRSHQQNLQPEQPKLSAPLLELANTKSKPTNHTPKASHQVGGIPPTFPMPHKGFLHSPRRRLRSNLVVPMAVTTAATKTVVHDDKNNNHWSSEKTKVKKTTIQGRNAVPDKTPRKSPIVERHSTVRVDKRDERDGMLNTKKNDDFEQNEDDMDCSSSDGLCFKSSSSSSVSPTDERKKPNGIEKDRQEKDYPTKIQKCPPSQVGESDRHSRRTKEVPASSPAPSISTTSFDSQAGFLQRAQKVENGEFFRLMMNSNTPTTAKRDGELLGATIGEDDRFKLHDDNSEITACTRASKTPPRGSGALSAGRNLPLKQKNGRGNEALTSPLIENLPFVAHHNNESGRKDDDEVSVEAWSMDGNTALPFQFKVDGKVFGHAPLPPGWKMKLSRTKKIPVYFHPDHGRTWYCPVVLPHKSMNMVYTRSSLRTIDVPELESPKFNEAELTSSLSKKGNLGSSLTPPSPPSTTHKLPFQSQQRRHSAPLVRAAHSSLGTPPSHVEKPYSSGKVESKATAKHQRDVLKISFQSGPETNAQRAMSGEHRPFLNHTTPHGQGGALHAQSSQEVNKAGNQQTPGTMSDVVNSYERDKGLVATALLSVQNKDQAGYDCDVSECSDSSSSLSSMDPRVLKFKATPRSRSKLLARLSQTKGECQLSPIRENLEHPPDTEADYFSPGGGDEIQQEGEEQSIRVEEQNTTEACELLAKQSHSQLQHPKTPPEMPIDTSNTRSSRSLNSKQRVASDASKQSEKSTEKEGKYLRTPNDTTPKQNRGTLVLEEVAVVRHASNRKKKHEKPLLSTGKKSNSSKQKKVHFSEASTAKSESPNFFSPLLGHNEELSPLAALGSRNRSPNQGSDPKHYLNSVTQEIRTETPNGLSTGKLLLVAGSSGSKHGKWKSPNCSGIEPSSGEESLHSPYRSDIQTPAVHGPVIYHGSGDAADQAESQPKATKPSSKLHLDDLEMTLEVESAQKPNDHTVTEAATEPESPMVFNTFGDDGSEGSMETPIYRGPDEVRLLSSSRRVQNVSTGRRMLLNASDISEADEDGRGRFSDDELGQSFRMVEKSPSETIYDSLMAVHTPKPFRQMSSRILHPPHPICSLQRLDIIFARTEKVKPNAKRSRSKPKSKMVQGRKTNVTKRAYSLKSQKNGRKRRSDD